MTLATGAGVLGRMTRRRPPETPDVPLTAARAVRLAVERGALAATGLAVTVTHVAERAVPLDGLLADCTDDLLLLALVRDDAVCGVIACDAGLVSAQIEMLTTGRVAGHQPDPRPVTRTEGTLALPLLTQILTEMGETTIRTALDGWMQGATLGTRFATARVAGFDLADQFYRLIVLTLTCGEGGRAGRLLLALPPQGGAHPGAALIVARPDRAADRAADWHDRFRAAVLSAPARLDAVLHRMTVPAAVLTALDVGQVLPLQGCTVGMVRLEDPAGRTIARGRLGQIAGQVAVRVQHTSDTLAMTDMTMADMLACDGPLTGPGVGAMGDDGPGGGLFGNEEGGEAGPRTLRTRVTDGWPAQIDVEPEATDGAIMGAAVSVAAMVVADEV